MKCVWKKSCANPKKWKLSAPWPAASLTISNNILAAIMGNAELLQRSHPVNSREQQRLGQLLSSCNRAADLVQQILTFSRKSKQERKPLHIIPLIRETLKLLRSTLPTNIEIKRSFTCHPDEDIILADATQVHQILMNLCTNAAHAIGPNSGTLEITVSPKELSRDTIVSFYPGLSSGRHICLTVSDSGPGIAPDLLQRIFDPYFTTKEVGKGTGLGLAVVKGIVASYNGSITVSSEPGSGTTFTLLFPMESRGHAERLPSGPSTLRTGKGRILLVDDEEMLLQVGGDILESLGYEVFPMASSQEALDLFFNRPGDFDLVMTDMTMPGLSAKTWPLKFWPSAPTSRLFYAPVSVILSVNKRPKH